jgi:hypothetical protein
MTVWTETTTGWNIEREDVMLHVNMCELPPIELPKTERRGYAGAKNAK